jgi:hypothetical protein
MSSPFQSSSYYGLYISLEALIVQFIFDKLMDLGKHMGGVNQRAEGFSQNLEPGSGLSLSELT